MKHSDCHNLRSKNRQDASIGEQPYIDEQLVAKIKARGGKPNSSSEFTAQIVNSECSSYPVLPSTKSKVLQERNSSLMQQVSQSNEEKLAETVKIQGI